MIEGAAREELEEAAGDAAPAGTMLTLDLLGPDHPGIVHDISHCLAEHGVSVEDLQTDIREAPMGGGTLFYAQARVRCPASLDEDELRQALEGLTAAFMVDVTLREEALA